MKKPCIATMVLLLAIAGAGCADPLPVEKRDRPVATGERMSIVYSPGYGVKFFGFEKLHPFDINKYERIYDRLISDRVLDAKDVMEPGECTDEDLLLVHTPEYLKELDDPAAVARYLEAEQVAWLTKHDCRKYFVDPFRRAAKGTIVACREAMKKGFAINLAGGYNHARAGRGGGFNLFQDMGLGIRAVQKDKSARTAMIVDCDVHGGDGQASVFAGDKSVFTISLHQRGIYGTHDLKSSIDVDLDPGTDDTTYRDALAATLPKALDEFKPDLVVYNAGTDVYKDDTLGRLALTSDGILKRDAYVVAECRRRNIPVAMTLGGGYSSESWKIHYLSIRSLVETWGTDPEKEKENAQKDPHVR
jgi:histone deacetylase 11